jgi:hypothetical protein
MKRIYVLLLAGIFINPAMADMISRYSFTTDANDSVGAHNGKLKGTAIIADGKVKLDGGGWVELPGGMVTQLNCAAVETWFSYQNNGNWVRVFDFGNTNKDGLGANCWYFTPKYPKGSRTTFSNTDPGYKYEETIDNKPLPENVPIYVAVIFDSALKKARLYVNARLIGERDLTVKLSDIGTEHLYLGKSSYKNDNLMKGTIDEFRIYNSALSDLQILLNYQLGPDNYQKCVLTSVEPANDVNQVSTDSSLSWAIDDKMTAGHYELAFGTDANSISPAGKTNPVFSSTKQPGFGLIGLRYNTTYYWRVDTIDGNKNRFFGPMLKFTTRTNF